MASCAIFAMLVSMITRKGKLNMEDVLNATLAGGVIMGASADIVTDPWAAFLIGSIGGVVSALGFRYLGEMAEKIGFHDTCGVMSLHGIPGFLGAIISAFVVRAADREEYGSYFDVFIFKSRSARQ